MPETEYLHKCSYFIRGCKDFLPCFDFRNSSKCCLQDTIWCVVNDLQQCLQISNFSKPVSKINENVIFFLSINSAIANFWCELKACIPNFHAKRVKIFLRHRHLVKQKDQRDWRAFLLWAFIRKWKLQFDWLYSGKGSRCVAPGSIVWLWPERLQRKLVSKLHVIYY